MLKYAATWDYLQAGFKFYVDEAQKLVVFAPETETIDIRVDVYSALKKWFSILDNAKYPFPIRSIGGDITTGTQRAGDTYFLINGYRVVYDVTKVRVSGILYSDDFDTPWLQKGSLDPVYPAAVSNLALAIETGGGGGATSEEIAALTASIAALADENTVITANQAALSAITTEIWRRLGLDPAAPLTNKDDGSISATDINIVATQSGANIIQTRQ